MNELLEFANKYGVLTAFLVFVGYQLLKLLEKNMPGVVSMLRKKSEAEIAQENKALEAETELRKLETLVATGSRTFTEEQLTALTAETQSQLAEASSFIRDDVSKGLDDLSKRLAVVEHKLDAMPNDVSDCVKEDLKAAASEWRMAVVEYRNLQAELGYFFRAKARRMSKPKQQDAG